MTGSARGVPLLLLLTLASARAQTPPPSPRPPTPSVSTRPALAALLPADTPLSDAAQDATGHVWAITSAPPSLYRWADGAWKRAPSPSEGVVPAALRTLPGGAVAVVWNAEGNSHILTEMRGDQSRTVAKWAGPLMLPRVRGTRNGDVWVAGAGGDLYRIDAKADGAGRVTHIFNPDKPGHPADRGPGNPLLSDAMDMTEDAQGRVWFWTPPTPVGSDPPTPRFLLYAGGKLAPPVITDLPSDPVDSVAVRNEDRLWLAIRDRGIFEVDLSTMSAQFVPSPQSNAFRRVQMMGTFGARFGVISRQGGDDGRSGVLWLWTDEGWTRAINGLDNQPALHNVAHRPVIVTKDGVWIGSYGAGAWLLPPSGGPARLLDWRVGFPVLFPDRMFQTPPAFGGLIALSLGAGQTATLAAHLEAVARRAPEISVLTFAVLFPLVQDGQGRLWRLDAPRTLPPVPPVLQEWDGSGHWRAHPLPDGAESRRLAGLRLGPDSRLWCVPVSGNGRRGPAPAYAFAPDSGVWTTGTLEAVPAPGHVASPRPHLPAGVPAPDPGSMARAADGTLWLTSGHVLYRVSADGKASPAFPSGTPTPFADGRRVREVLLDPQGSVFLRTDIGGRSEYVLIPKR